ncbi:MAG: UbiA family prenyltransferase [Candidatus Sumerlaeaceae bacterium]|nr:UbiA family prenyltransferase [Candidatus Sumerlaeaceae bacterium]
MKLYAYFLHLRPRSWPIVFAHYACGAIILVVHAPTALVAAAAAQAILGGIIWAVCLNGGTLALNSAFDRDEGDIGYLDNPPPVPKHLATLAVLLMICGLVLAYLLLPASFFLILALCVVLSLLYSVPPARLKAVAGADLVVNMIGYGAATIAAGALATGLLPGLSDDWKFRIVCLSTGFAFLFGAFYPMTQIYQIPEDSARGDKTLVIGLGARRSLVLAVIFELIALVLHLGGLLWFAPSASVYLWAKGAVVAQGAAWLIFTADWLRRLDFYPAKRGMYRALWLWALSDVVLVIAYGWGIMPASS